LVQNAAIKAATGYGTKTQEGKVAAAAVKGLVQANGGTAQQASNMMNALQENLKMAAQNGNQAAAVNGVLERVNEFYTNPNLGTQYKAMSGEGGWGDLGIQRYRAGKPDLVSEENHERGMSSTRTGPEFNLPLDQGPPGMRDFSNLPFDQGPPQIDRYLQQSWDPEEGTEYQELAVLSNFGGNLLDSFVPVWSPFFVGAAGDEVMSEELEEYRSEVGDEEGRHSDVLLGKVTAISNGYWTQDSAYLQQSAPMYDLLAPRRVGNYTALGSAFNWYNGQQQTPSDYYNFGVIDNAGWPYGSTYTLPEDFNTGMLDTEKEYLYAKVGYKGDMMNQAAIENKIMEIVLDLAEDVIADEIANQVINNVIDYGKLKPEQATSISTIETPQSTEGIATPTGGMTGHAHGHQHSY
jgi:hypothetical protein